MPDEMTQTSETETGEQQNSNETSDESEGSASEEEGNGEENEEDDEDSDEQYKTQIAEIQAEIDKALKSLADDVGVEIAAVKKEKSAKTIMLVLSGLMDALGYVCMIFPPVTLILSVVSAVVAVATAMSPYIQQAQIKLMSMKLAKERAARRAQKLITCTMNRFLNNTLLRVIEVVPVVNGIFPAWVMAACSEWVASKRKKEQLETVRADTEAFKEQWKRVREDKLVVGLYGFQTTTKMREQLRAIDGRYMNVC
ncbi:MAG: hypothetical protein Q7R79_05170 [bacterium]|nr:hypothetical protein [bacterium]